MKKIKNKQGVTMIETALMMGFILALLGLIFSGGQIINNKMALNAAAYRAARAAAVKTNTSEAKKVAEEQVISSLRSNGMAFENISVSVTPKNGSWKKNNTVTVTVSATTKTLFPIPDQEKPIYAGTKVKMKSNTSMMIEKEK